MEMKNVWMLYQTLMTIAWQGKRERQNEMVKIINHKGRKQLIDYE